MDGLSLNQDSTRYRAWPGLNGNCVQEFLVLQVLLVSSSDPVACREAISAVLRPPNDCLLRTAQARCGLDQRVEYRLQVECRTADDLEHVGSRGLLLKRFAQFVEQPRVLDCDDGLRGEILDQLNLFVGERTHLLAIDGDTPD